MTLEGFLEITETRIPTVAELVELCEALQISFSHGEAGPVMKTSASVPEAKLLASIFRREPFRSMVLEMRLRGSEKSQVVCQDTGVNQVAIPESHVASGVRVDLPTQIVSERDQHSKHGLLMIRYDELSLIEAIAAKPDQFLNRFIGLRYADGFECEAESTPRLHETPVMFDSGRGWEYVGVIG